MNQIAAFHKEFDVILRKLQMGENERSLSLILFRFSDDMRCVRNAVWYRLYLMLIVLCHTVQCLLQFQWQSSEIRVE